jgi:hypothetical protein
MADILEVYKKLSEGTQRSLSSFKSLSNAFIIGMRSNLENVCIPVADFFSEPPYDIVVQTSSDLAAAVTDVNIRSIFVKKPITGASSLAASVPKNIFGASITFASSSVLSFEAGASIYAEIVISSSLTVTRYAASTVNIRRVSGNGNILSSASGNIINYECTENGVAADANFAQKYWDNTFNGDNLPKASNTVYGVVVIKPNGGIYFDTNGMLYTKSSEVGFTSISDGTNTVTAESANEILTFTSDNSSIHVEVGADENGKSVSISHAESGAIAGDYGPSNSSVDPGYGGSFSVPMVAVDTQGHIISAGNASVKIPDLVTYDEQYASFRINSGTGPYYVKIAEAAFGNNYGAMDLTCGVGGSSTSYGEFSVKVIRAINGVSLYAQWNSLFNKNAVFQLEEIRCFYISSSSIQLWAKTVSPFSQSSLSFEPLVNIQYNSSGVAIGRAFAFQKIGASGAYPSTFENYCYAKSENCLSSAETRRTVIASSDSSLTVTVTETYDGKGYTNNVDLKGTFKVLRGADDALPGYFGDKIVGSDWISREDITESDIKKIQLALKNPEFFIKGNTIYGGIVTDNFDIIGHTGFFTGYYNTTGAPTAQVGNPSWFVLHMNSNVGVVSAIQVAYAYVNTSIICYERVKLASTWGAWILRSSGGGTTVSPIVYDATMDKAGAVDNVALNAGSETQWSAHGTLMSPKANMTPVVNTSSFKTICPQPVSGASYIIAAYKTITSGTHELICSSSILSMPSSSSVLEALITRKIADIVGGDQFYFTVFTNGNGIQLSGIAGSNLNMAPYISGIKNNLGVLTEAPSTITFDGETGLRLFGSIRI